MWYAELVVLQLAIKDSGISCLPINSQNRSLPEVKI